MKVKIMGEDKEIQVTSVILAPDINDPKGENLYMFHCWKCGNKILQFQGTVVKIIPGMVPAKLPTIIRCSNSKCKQHYYFYGL
jgi:hypothetical protein